MQEDSIPLINEKLKETAQTLLIEGIDKFEKVLIQFKKTQAKNMQQLDYSENISIQWTTTLQRVGEIALYVSLLGGLIYWAVQSLSWSYEQALDEVAEQLLKNFNKGQKYKLITQITNFYDQMTSQCEERNLFEGLIGGKEQSEIDQQRLLRRNSTPRN